MLFLLLACSPAQIAIGDPTKDGSLDSAPAGETADTSPPPPEPMLAITGPEALDPVLAPSVDLLLTETAGDTVALTVYDAAGAPVRTLTDGTTWVDSVAWDGRDDAGALLPVGSYSVHGDLAAAGVVVATADRPLWIVRVGVTTGTLGGERIALCWHDGGSTYFDGGDDTATFAISSIDTVDADGATTATPIPAVWADLDAPPSDPVGQNMPAAYPWDALPSLALTVAGDTADAPVRVRIAGWTADAETVAAGDTVTLQADAPLTDGLGVLEPTLTLEWVVGDDVFATQSVPLRIYALLGPPAFEQTGAPYEPWPTVIDPLLRAAGTIAPTLPAVGAAVVDEVYWNLGLAYDTRSGASAYTQYRNGYDDAVFDLSAFVDRRRGSIVNCTDCASIVTTYAGMLGADISYAIILDNFDLNYIRAIGGDTFTNCPFDSGRCGFRYHAVTTPDDTATIYDATLALDGDEDPSSSPSTELMVHGVAGAEYLDRLVMAGAARYDYVQHGAFH